jgi:hypothetical protein
MTLCSVYIVLTRGLHYINLELSIGWRDQWITEHLPQVRVASGLQGLLPQACSCAFLASELHRRNPNTSSERSWTASFDQRNPP